MKSKSHHSAGKSRLVDGSRKVGRAPVILILSSTSQSPSPAEQWQEYWSSKRMKAQQGLPLADLQGGGPRSLKKTITRVRQRDGSLREEVLNEDGTYRQISVAFEPLPDFLVENSRGISSLKSHIFEGNGWVEYEPDDGRPMVQLLPANQEQTADKVEGVLKIISYNVWFSEEDKMLRAQGLLDLVLSSDPDIICLQEVTRPFLGVLLLQPWV